MKISMKPSGRDFENAKPGMHPAILIGIVELGTAKTNFGDKNEVQFIWELHGEEGATSDGTPFLVFQKYTANFGTMDQPSNLNKMLTGYIGKSIPLSDDAEDMDLSRYLGRPGMVTLTSSTSGGKEYVNVTGFMKPPKAMMAAFPADTHNEPFLIDLSDADKCTSELLARVGKKSRERIISSKEYKLCMSGGKPAKQQADDDDMPTLGSKKPAQAASAPAAKPAAAPAAKKSSVVDIDDEIPF